ncbi:MAG: hypothetical protein LLG97_17315 [Deltaproteobacteria bacterium]|nr:hypothetical protein [Deltaproteobacteria bacterium]
MKENYRIRFNPTTREIEIEGSETFVKTYFDRLQAILSGSREAGAEGAKAAKTAEREAGGKRVTQIDQVVSWIRESSGGISTAELKDKTGLVENQIWSIVNRAAKLGRIKKLKRGVYGAP